MSIDDEVSHNLDNSFEGSTVKWDDKVHNLGKKKERSKTKDKMAMSEQKLKIKPMLDYLIVLFQDDRHDEKLFEIIEKNQQD